MAHMPSPSIQEFITRWKESAATPAAKKDAKLVWPKTIPEQARQRCARPRELEDERFVV
jgi:hypothetical protein